MAAYGMHFVMMYSQNEKHAMPILDGNGDVCLFMTSMDARNAMDKHPFAQTFGYEIFCMGEGED